MLWHSGGHELPGELLESLTKKVGRVVVCTEPYAALAEACMIDREYADLARAGGQPRRAGGAGVLLLLQPETLPLTEAILDAAALYAPGLQCWQYDRTANPKLRAIVLESVTTSPKLPSSAPLVPQTRPVSSGLPAAAARGAPGMARPAADGRMPAAGLAELKPEETRGGAASPGAGTAAAARAGLHLADAPPTVAISGPGLSAHAPPSSVTTHSGWPIPDQTTPRLRIAGTEAVQPAESRPRATPLLTEDELSILLSDDPLPVAAPRGQSRPASGGQTGRPGGER